MLIRYKIYNTVKTVTVPENNTVADLRNIIIDKNDIEPGYKLRFILNGKKMIKSRKLERYNLTCRAIIIVKTIKKNSLGVKLGRMARGLGPRGNDWAWSRSK